MGEITHAFVSEVEDDVDTSLVRPSNWNDGHVTPLTTKGDLLVTQSGGVIDRLEVGSTGYVLVADSTATPGIKWSSLILALTFQVQGDLATAYATGAVAGFVEVPTACTILGWDLEHDAASTTTIDVKKRAAGGGTATSIVGAGTKPSTSAQSENASTTLTNWTTSISANDKLYLNVDANNNAKWSVLHLRVRRD